MARITVVDEYPGFVSAVFQLSEATGHRVAGLDAAEATLERLIESDPELLVLDERSAIDGDQLALLLLVRSDPALQAVPLIICSADVAALQVWAHQFPQIGHVVGLAKPYSGAQLRAAVRGALPGVVELEPRPPAQVH